MSTSHDVKQERIDDFRSELARVLDLIERNQDRRGLFQLDLVKAL